MAGVTELILRLKTELDKGELDKAKGSFQQLAIGVGAAFAAFGGARAIIGFLKDSAAAAEAEEMSLIKLRSVLSGVTSDYKAMSEEVNNWALNVAYNSLNAEEEIIGAFQQVVAVTGDVANAYKIVQASVDIAAARNKDLGSVVEAVSKAYQGNYMMLVRLVPELRTSIDAGASMADIMDQLGRFSGIAAQQMEGGLGTIRATAIAYGEVQEAIGGVINTVKAGLALGILNLFNLLGLGDANSEAVSLRSEIARVRAELQETGKVNLYGVFLDASMQAEYLAGLERKLAELTVPIKEGWWDVTKAIAEAMNKPSMWQAMTTGPKMSEAAIGQYGLQDVQAQMDSYSLQLEVARKQYELAKTSGIGLADATREYLSLLEGVAGYLSDETADLNALGVAQNEILKLTSSELSLRQQIVDMTKEQSKVLLENESILARAAKISTPEAAAAAAPAPTTYLGELAAMFKMSEKAIYDIMQNSGTYMMEAIKDYQMPGWETAGGGVDWGVYKEAGTTLGEAATNLQGVASDLKTAVGGAAGGAGKGVGGVSIAKVDIMINGTGLDPAAIAQAIEQRLRTFSETAGNAIGNLPL